MIKRNVLSEQIYIDLKKKIEQFEYIPEERISEITLAKLYDVSRTPIKHSLARLENENLVYVKPQIGTFVTKIDVRHIKEFFTVRMLLETAIINDVKTNINSKFQNKLKENLIKQNSLVDDFDNYLDIELSKEFWKLDNEFHKIIFDSVNKGFIWDMILSQSPQFNRYRFLTASLNKDDLQEKVISHKRIYDYLILNKDDDIKFIYEHHLFDPLAKDLESLTKKYPNYFE